MQKKRFTELGLSDELLKAVARMGFEEASPIQSESIPVLMEGSDVVGQSQTGSGKTAAFAIPAVEKVDPSIKAPQVLILCPTRELAVQVAEEVAKLAWFKKGVRELPIYGGQSYERQFRGLEEGAQIIIGTPGRVMDHLDRGSLRLDQLRMVILDEADRMLDMGFLEDIRTVLGQAPPERQTVFFSATLPPAIQNLIRSFTRNPVNVKIAVQEVSAPAIEQVYYEVDRRSKLDVLCRLIDMDDIRFGIIFCATKLAVDDLVEHLIARGYAADKMHGDMTQAMRERVIGRFRKRALEFLVATDVAARGLDVDDIEVVFNYDLPHDGEDYIHRIGRTGRAGRSGKAITFVAGREIYRMQNIIRYTKSRIRRERVPTIEQVESRRADKFYELLRKTLEEGKYEKRDALIDRLLEQGHSPTDIASAVLHLAGGNTQPEPARPAAPAPKESRMEKRPMQSQPQPTSRREESAPRERREAPAFKPREERPRLEKKEWKALEERPLPKGGRRAEGDHEFGPVSHEPGMVRLAMGVGTSHDVNPGDVLGVILGVTKLPREAVGAIRLQGKQTFVDIVEAQADGVVKKLSGITFKGRKIWCKRAKPPMPYPKPQGLKEWEEQQRGETA